MKKINFKKDQDIKLIEKDKLKNIPAEFLIDISKVLNSAAKTYFKRGAKSSELGMHQNLSKMGWCNEFADALKSLANNKTHLKIDNGFRIQNISRFSILLNDMIKDKLEIAETLSLLYDLIRSSIIDYKDILNAYEMSY